MRRPTLGHRAPRGAARWLVVLAALCRAAVAMADPDVPGLGVPDSWELGGRVSYQRLSGALVTSQVSVGSFLGYYLDPSFEPWAGLALDFQDARVDQGASSTAINVSAGAGVRASFALAERVRPYLSLSPGLLLRTADIAGANVEDQLDFVLSVQTGLQVELVPRVALDVGFAYDRIFSDVGEDLLTVPVGLSFFF